MLKGVKKVTAGQNDLNSHPNLGTPGKNGGGGEAERSKEGHSRPKWMEEERLQKNEKGYRIEALEILAIPWRNPPEKQRLFNNTKSSD